MKYIYVLFFLPFLSCVSKGEHEKLLDENRNLRKQVAQLELKLDEILNGPDRLLSEAKVLIDSEKYHDALNTIKRLNSKHPLSPQAKESSGLVVIVEKYLKNQAEEAEREKIKKENEEKKRVANAVSKMRSRHDDIKDITWYRHKTSPEARNVNGLFIYFGKSNNSAPWLRFVIQHTGDDWLFIERYIIKVDNETFTITENEYGEIEKDNGYGGIWEWLDRSVSSQEREIIKAVSNGKNVKLRLEGKQYYRDRTITETQKQAIRDVLAAYYAMGGAVL